MADATLGAKNTSHPEVSAWVEQMAALCKPDRIFWCSGSEVEKEHLTDSAVPGHHPGAASGGVEGRRSGVEKEVLSQDELFINLHSDLPAELNYQRELLIARL